VAESETFQGMSPAQQLAYVRDLRRIYDVERERRRDLEAANRALADANRELDRRLEDLLAAQDWILAVNSSRELASVMDLLAQPLVLLLGARTTVVFPWDPQTGALGSVLGYGAPAETAELAALRTSPLSAAVMAQGRLWAISDLDAAEVDADTGAARALGWRALVAAPLVAREQPVGLLYVGWEAPRPIGERERTLIGLLAQHAAVSLSEARLRTEAAERAAALERAEQQLVAYARDLRRSFEAERQRRAEVQAAYRATVRVLAAAIETRDPYTGGHVERVSTFAVAIGRQFGWSDDQLDVLELGALLHDVGKLGVEDRVLRKPGPLDDAEWEQMRQHPALGAALLRAVPFLHGSVDCALRHHERYDGKGYPDGLAGAEIPLEARIVAVADAFDAMTSDRPYRKGLAVAVALAELERHAGTQFDPSVVAAFLEVVRTGAVTLVGSAMP